LQKRRESFSKVHIFEPRISKLEIEQMVYSEADIGIYWVHNKAYRLTRVALLTFMIFYEASICIATFAHCIQLSSCAAAFNIKLMNIVLFELIE